MHVEEMILHAGKRPYGFQKREPKDGGARVWSAFSFSLLLFPLCDAAYVEGVPQSVLICE